MNSKDVLSLLKEKNLTISFAESITGGSLASDLVSNSGASKVFSLGVVTYSNEVKSAVLGVKEETLTEYGAVSLDVIKEMAINIKSLAKSDIGVATSGNAGPEVLGNTNVGDVYVGVAYLDKVKAYKITINEDNRNKIIKKTVKKTWELVGKILITI